MNKRVTPIRLNAREAACINLVKISLSLSANREKMKYRCRLLYNAQDPTRNIERKNSSPLKIKRVKFVKILSFEFTLVFSPRDKYTPRFLPLPYKSPTYTDARAYTHTHAARVYTVFSGSTISEGGEEGEGDIERENSAIRGKTWMNGVKIWDIVRGPVFRSFRKRGSRKRRATLYLFRRSVPGARATGIRLPFRRISPQIFSWHAPHPIYTIFWKSFIRFPLSLSLSPSLARANGTQLHCNRPASPLFSFLRPVDERPRRQMGTCRCSDGIPRAPPRVPGTRMMEIERKKKKKGEKKKKEKFVKRIEIVKLGSMSGKNARN